MYNSTVEMLSILSEESRRVRLKHIQTEVTKINGIQKEIFRIQFKKESIFEVGIDSSVSTALIQSLTGDVNVWTATGLFGQQRLPGASERMLN